MIRHFVIVPGFLAVLLCLTSPIQASEISSPDAGNWTVGECILAQFAMEFTVHFSYNKSNVNQTTTVDVPVDAKVSNTSSHCGEDMQVLALEWKDRAPNDTSLMLDRNITIVFEVKPNTTYYGVSRLYAVFALGVWTSNKTVYKSNIEIDSGDITNLMFHTPLDRSFLCADVGNLELNTVLKYPWSPPAGTKLSNSTVIGKKVQFDAFRSNTITPPPPGFRTPMDCDYMPNDIVPIAVGVTLALLVICILIAYMIGRRKHRQRGYESV